MNPSFLSLWTQRSADNQRRIYSIVTLFVALVMICSFIYYVVLTQRINTQSDQLTQLRQYDLSSITQNETLKDALPLRQTIGDMVKYGDQLREQVTSYGNYRKQLSLPYTYFLHYVYTPSLNIWKDPFTQKIDTNLVWEKYLVKNPYNDIALIQKRTNFFKDMGSVDQYNTITNISIGDITPQSGGFFGIPVTVQFETPDRRSFLLLVNKLSMTSYADNVSSMSEFMYNIWDVIKKERKDVIQRERDWLILSWVQNDDAFIGYMMYQRVYGTGDITSLIDATIINKAIAQTAWCTDQSSDECLYLFRDKYRYIPYLAYGVGRGGIDTVAGLKHFLHELPPLIAIDSFSFDLKQKRTFGRTRDNGYKWTITITVYGKDVSPGDMAEIASLLGKKCFRDGSSLSVLAWQQRVEDLINQLGSQDINIRRSNQIQDMKDYFATIALSYDDLSYYKKVIRLFEIYRTLSEWDGCDIINDASLWWDGSQWIDNANTLTSVIVWPSLAISPLLSWSIATSWTSADATIWQDK